MIELLTAAQMRAVEAEAIESGAVSALELMERAGQGVVDAVIAEWPDLSEGTRRAVVLCGPGNNGGDGFVIARLLAARGWDVEVFLYGNPESLPPDAMANNKRWCEVGAVRVHPINPPPSMDDNVSVSGPFDLLVDGLFGTGLMRPFQGPFTVYAQMRERLRDQSGRVVAVDIPTGLCSDSGRILGTAIPADLTVTFHTAKVGHELGAGPEMCGRVQVHDIGLSHESKDRALLQEGAFVQRVEPPSCAWLAKRASQHKFSHGHALILSGGPGHTGAARLAARSALRVGAGLVTLGVSPAAQMEVAMHITALMLQRVEDTDNLSDVLKDERVNALCLGPGFGSGAREQALIAAALEAKRPTVLDADALSILFFDEADALFGKLHEKCVLTPHAGEFARMFPDIAEKLNAAATNGPAYSKVDATREAAKRAGCVVLFKGPDTVIAHPDGRASVHAASYERAVPWLATAGAGDVLAGIITGLLARGFDPMCAAETGAWLHAECARVFGPALIAEDLPEQLPQVFGALAT